MPDITMKRERTDRWTKMRLSGARSSGTAASCHMLSSVDCITTTSESEFSVHTVRRIGMLSEFSEAQMQPMISAFRQQLRQFGWKDESIAIDSRFAIIDAAQFQAISAALVGTAPDLVVAVGSRAVQALKDQTQTIPVVF